jgi:hypothetical protein
MGASRSRTREISSGSQRPPFLLLRSRATSGVFLLVGPFDDGSEILGVAQLAEVHDPAVVAGRVGEQVFVPDQAIMVRNETVEIFPRVAIRLDPLERANLLQRPIHVFTPAGRHQVVPLRIAPGAPDGTRFHNFQPSINELSTASPLRTTKMNLASGKASTRKGMRRLLAGVLSTNLMRSGL